MKQPSPLGREDCKMVGEGFTSSVKNQRSKGEGFLFSFKSFLNGFYALLENYICVFT